MSVVISSFSVTEESYNIENNTSLIRVVLQAYSDASWNYDATYGWLKTDGSIVAEYTNSFEVGDTITLVNNTYTISHNSDGSKTINVAYAWDTGLNSTGTLSGSANVSLTTIPRASKIGSVSPFNIEDTFSVPITKYAASFTDTLNINIGSTLIKTVSGYTNGSLISLTDAEILAAYNAMSGLSTTVTFALSTKNDSATIGTDSKTVTVAAAGTAHIKVNGSYKRAVVWTKISGTWKKAICFIKASGNFKRCT